ncbi:hypothetical protein F511_11816 [Dorcoceras hygrometricum]|uniref:Uncharacterized protein n=1 Tax=Dorcoceras hygrometricum TaxID=472368 RepID=A0A2Z7DCH5_9LAMI|nr:hypothetical protein F511_11816 [Dorcoceras hygrometricum]
MLDGCCALPWMLLCAYVIAVLFSCYVYAYTHFPYCIHISVAAIVSYLVLLLLILARMRGRATIPHSHLPAGIVSHHAPSGLLPQFMGEATAGNPGFTAGRGYNPARGAPGGGNPGFTAGRGYNPARGAPGGG